MENHPSILDDLPPVWDRLRQQLEQMRIALGRQTDPETRAKLLTERGKLVRHQAGEVEPAGVPVSFLAITKDRKRYGILLEYVLEAQGLEQFSPVPGTPPFIRGVVHWRGSILSLLDLTKLFEIADTGISDLHAYVVVEAAGKRLAVVVSTLDDIISIPRNQLRIAPELPGKIAAEWVVGIHDETRLILRMDEIFKHLRPQSEG